MLARLCPSIHQPAGRWIALQLPCKLGTRLQSGRSAPGPVAICADHHRRGRRVGLGQEDRRKAARAEHCHGAGLDQHGPRGGRMRFSVMLERTVHELQGVPCITFEDAPAAKKEIACPRSFWRAITAATVDRGSVKVRHARTREATAPRQPDGPGADLRAYQPAQAWAAVQPRGFAALAPSHLRQRGPGKRCHYGHARYLQARLQDAQSGRHAHGPPAGQRASVGLG